MRKGRRSAPAPPRSASRALWCFAFAGFGRDSVVVELLLVASNLAWLWMLYRMFGHDKRDTSLAPIRPVVAALALVETMQFALIAARLQYDAQPAAQDLILQFSFTFRLLLNIGALVLVHNLYVGASQQARVALRWPAAGLGALFLYDLNFYTIAYLGSGTPQLLEDLRAVALLVTVALLAMGMLRNESELRFRPSRSFAFQSFSLLLIGAYLAVMVVVAQGLAYVGSDYGRILQTGFVLLASLVALTVLPSRKLRGLAAGDAFQEPVPASLRLPFRMAALHGDDGPRRAAICAAARTRGAGGGGYYRQPFGHAVHSARGRRAGTGGALAVAAARGAGRSDIG